MAHTVFISYSHKDRHIAESLCAAIESADARCWIAPRDIAPGLDWPTAISNAIAASRVLLLVFSANSNASRDVSRELSLASDNNLLILPFKIDDCTPEPGKQYYLARTHWLEAANPPTRDHIDNLVRHVKAFLARQESPAAAQPAPAIKVPQHNLPAQVTSFIGRRRELSEVRQAVAGHRLVTLTGPGGTGKTRLALQAAGELLDGFPMGVYLVELAPLGQPALVPSAIAAGLKFKQDPGRPALDTLGEYLSTRRILLVLDNCEHLVEACAQVAETLLRLCPDLHILATSREALNIAGEKVFHVPALSSPPVGDVEKIEVLIQFEAVQLFTERAAAVRPGFSLTSRNAPAVAQLCRRLDGIPLALELAAARMKALTVEQVAARLDDRFSLLTSGSRTALPRQQTLRATIDWSHDLLSEPERVLFRRLSVFAGGWSLESAEKVTCEAPLNEPAILDLLTGLVDKSLVFAEEGAGEARYHMLETIQQYGGEKLFEAGEKEQLQDCHLDYFIELAAMTDMQLRGPEAKIWLDRLDAELDNLRRAQAWVLESRNLAAGLRLAGILPHYWNQRSYISEGIEWSEKILALEAGQGGTSPAVSSQSARAQAFNEIAALFIDAGLVKGMRWDLSRAIRLSRESLALYTKLGDQKGQAAAQYNLSAANMIQNNLVEARAAGEQSLKLAKAVGDKWLCAEALSELGIIAACSGDLEMAKEYNIEGLSLRREIGDWDGAAWELVLLGAGVLYQGQYAEASGYLKEALQLSSRLENTHLVGMSLSRLGPAVLGLGQDQLAEQYLKEGLKLPLTTREHSVLCLLELGGLAGCRKQWERSARLLAAVDFYLEGAPLILYGPGVRERYAAAARANMDKVAFEAAWAAGRAMTVEQAIAFALEEPPS